ncbi:MAG TPA: radical SAM protein [Candidatus Methanoperedens sp.]
MKKINFFITSSTFPSISVTGKSCALMCKHCQGKLLESLIPATTCEELEKKALSLHEKGAKGMLITGGCDRYGKVPIGSLIPAIRKIKEKTDLILIAHTGFISRKEAAALKESGLDGIGFDVVGDMETAKEIYGLDVSEKDYMESLRALEDCGIAVFPHVCVGLHSGKMKGELHALELIQHITPVTIIITALMPVAETPMEHVRPDPSDFEKVIKKAIEMFPGTPVVLGCAHSIGKGREEIERIAIHNGISGIAAPSLATVELVKIGGYEVSYYRACCGLVLDEKTRLRGSKPFEKSFEDFCD